MVAKHIPGPGKRNRGQPDAPRTSDTLWALHDFRLARLAPRAIVRGIIDYLVPELKRRGRYRDAYTGRTLRENPAT